MSKTTLLAACLALITMAATDGPSARAAEAAAQRLDDLRAKFAADRKAIEAAKATWREKFEAVIAENPEAKALMNEMRSLEERLQQLRNQMGELRRP